MKNFKSIFFIAISSLFLVACFGTNVEEPEASPEEVIKEGIKNMSNIDTATYNVGMTANFVNKDPNASDFDEMELEGNFSGQYDFQDLSEAKFSLLIEMIASLNKSNQENMNAEIKIVDNNLYFAINEISDFDGELPVEMFSSFLAKWWYMPIPQDNMDALIAYADNEDENISPEEKAVQELLDNSFVFKNVKYLGGEKVKNQIALHYGAELDKNALRDALIETAEIMGETVLDSDLEQVDQFLKMVELEIELWINEENKTLVKVALDGTIEEPNIMLVELSGSYTLSNLNEEVKIDIPEDASMFDPLSLLMGASAIIPEDELYGDEFTFNESEFETDFTIDESMFGEEMMFDDLSGDEFTDLSY